ncbi:dihydrolipoyl dehydrogenase [Mesobacillus subterraneus]|uniref:Dihydrolipoyl dehydrogenase n=1 Tax=Mesobacillus subterraneus TaxID=285983 RepID=A0A427TED7_9BACI|nr:dihydrolipoyl dehydrogenase [Mesobacillus subterraneus]RSD21117.1 dihydrolipoyl dehydrogenase [Mesobacillus subterraneus]
MVVGELAHERDLVIIGGGPGGYHAAIRAAQLGKNVTLIEKDQLGGICLNKGCIPSKVMTHAAERMAASRQDEMLGIETRSIHFEISKLLNYKNQVVSQLRSGVEALCKANKVEVIKGSAFFLSEDKIGVENEDKYEVYRFNEAIIATGGTPVKLSGAPKSDRILDIWAISDLSAVPEHLVVIGDDYIALEMAMAFQAFGSKVTLVLSGEDYAFDSSINRELGRILKKARITVVKGYSIEEPAETGVGVTVLLSCEKGSKTVEGSHLFYSLGTKPQIDHLGIDRLGIKLSQEGFIVTDQTGRTSISNIFAIGDVTEGPQLAVKAIKQGKTAAETICGRASENDLNFIPHIARIQPPIATVGLTEQEAAEQGYEVGIGEFSMSANGFAAILGKKEGLVKVVFDKQNDVLLGVHMIGAGAVELISNGIQALEMAARDEDFTFPSYPHPSVNEALLEAVEAFKGEAIHSVPKKQKVKI